MGLLTPLAVRIGSIPWMPRYLPQIVKCDNVIRAVTGERYGLLDIAGLPNTTVVVAGRRSGKERQTRLLAVPRSGGRWLIAGSYFGGEKTPQWVYNLRATDSAEIIDRGRRRAVRVAELHDDHRAAAWQELRSVWPNFDIYQKRTDRLIPVFELTPTD
ncbi:nitroreductase family deazaflavin-dependent oxidoreductase [Gordonia oryzae]|uniref:Nitroreductase family deazaflavin-dependent oxidoreductase n=1 Tax=Gordonia oryzae TaxID=2487349 RepID=A0A3N4GGT5_9ACTN|nr:nitroreductase/quinone reductase family protein [Gordonia oryzae]RPA57810.1 nitroreductase family deazaflavin-dependent oxidoreductase [Gordonia oryzae]